LPIAVTLPGMVTAVRPLQYLNALAPIEVTLSGMSTEVRLQFSNAEVPIEVTGLPLIVEGIITVFEDPV
jgi:hypothetical protein